MSSSKLKNKSAVETLLKVEHLNVILGDNPILSDIHLTVKRGQIVTLIGPNGAGKSTLVKTILGLIKPQSGKVILEPGINVGYMPQKLLIDSFLPLTVERFLSLSAHVSQQQKKWVLEVLSLSPLLQKPMQGVSGGELQRVLLARALLRAPDLLVLDEPMQGVDVSGQDELYPLILDIRDYCQCGILLVSHDLHFVMAGTDSVICLNGHICCSGHPEVVSQHPAFLSLFGQRKPLGFAFYTHDHNHKH
jgi:zinc transport system ATP-binding protein